MALGSDPNPLHDRDPGFKDVDIAAISAIAHAAIDVELFTIPLYMTSLYSIQAMHQITSQGNDFYKGRLWPGPAPSAWCDRSADQASPRAAPKGQRFGTDRNARWPYNGNDVWQHRNQRGL
jgi:hypothetical protein